MADIFLDRINTFEDMGARNSDGSPMTFREMLTNYYPLLQGVMGRPRPRGTPLPLIPDGLLPKYTARINHGRWLVDCPYCNSALNVTPADDMAICLDCGTEWFQVVFPGVNRRREIERILVKRPGDLRYGFPHSNWRPGESVASLRTENLAHGLEG